MPATVITLTLTLGGVTLESFGDAQRAALAGALRNNLGCHPPACVLDLHIAAGSVVASAIMTIADNATIADGTGSGGGGGDDGVGGANSTAAAVASKAHAFAALSIREQSEAIQIPSGGSTVVVAHTLTAAVVMNPSAAGAGGDGVGGPKSRGSAGATVVMAILFPLLLVGVAFYLHRERQKKQDAALLAKNPNEVEVAALGHHPRARVTPTVGGGKSASPFERALQLRDTELTGNAAAI